MSGAIAMGSNKITGVTNPTANQDASTKAYTDAQRDTRVAKTGDSMSGALAMGTNKITGLGTPTANADATTKLYVDNILGSATVAATSASNAASSQTAAANSATASANSATASAASAASAAASYDLFDDRFLGAKSSAPSADNDGGSLVVGTLYFDTTAQLMKVYGSSGWQSAGSAVNGTSERYKYVATNNQTTFSGADANSNALGYDAGFLDVYLSGIRLVNGVDFTATSGTSVQLASGATTGDILEIVTYGTFVLSNQTLNGLTDVNTGGVSTNNILAYNGSTFVPTATPTFTSLTSPTITGNTTFTSAQTTLRADDAFLRVEEADGTDIAYLGDITGAGVGGLFLYNHGGSGNTILRADAASTIAHGLSVGGDVTITANVLHSGDSDTYFGFNANDSWRVVTGNEERLKVNNGEVVVNDNSVDMDFRVESNSNTHALFVNGDLGTVGINCTATNAKLEVVSTSGEVFRADSSGGAYRVVVNQTGVNMNGLVGVGTTNPVAPFAVGGSGRRIEVDGASGVIRGFDRSASWAALDFEASAYTFDVSTARMMDITSSGVVINEDSADADFRVESNSNTHALFVDAGLNRVGVLTSSPAAPLDIQFGDNSNILRGSYASGEDNFFLELDSKIVTGGVVGYQFHLKNNGTAYNNTLTLDRGNVGVGVESADAKLHVNGNFLAQSSTTLNSTIRATGNNTRAIGNYQAHDSSGNDVNMVMGVFGDANRGEISTATNHTLRLYVNNQPSKYLEIGTTGQIFTSHGMVINEDSHDSDFRVESNNNSHMLFVDAGGDKVGINNNAPGTELDVTGGMRSDYIYHNAAYSQTGGVSLNYWKIGRIGVSGPSSGELTMYGSRGSYSAGYPIAGKTVFQFRGGTTATVLDAVWHSEGQNGVKIPIMGYVPVGSHEFDIYAQLPSYCSLEHAVSTGGGWTESISNTGSSSAPTGFVNVAPQFNVLLGNYSNFLVTQNSVIVNEDSYDVDFRVESNADTHALFVDADNDQVLIGNIASTQGEDYLRFDARPGTSGHLIISGRDDTSTKNHHVFVNPNGVVGSIQTAGSATAYNTSSDQRLKENIADADDAGSKIDSIQVRKFDWKADGSHQDYGMIAQELQTVAPEAVSALEDPDEMMGVDYSKLVPMLVKEIQTLRSRITALENA
jgi:hypothetical protein